MYSAAWSRFPTTSESLNLKTDTFDAGLLYIKSIKAVALKTILFSHLITNQ